ncbi:hypothetical protein CVR96_26955, partial [Salmonella enterica subsp. enterica serovar Typhimurium]|uniref:hypothetical protein n=1 Tax=Salmonella enterica TaxID=28901 RepID=UPI000CACDA9C
QTFDVDDVDEDVEDGEAVVLEFDENNEEFVEDIFTGSAADDYIETGLTVDSVDVGNDRVTFTNGETYTLVDDGAVIDATDTNDISD